MVNLSLKINTCLFQYAKNKQPLSDFQAQIGADPKQPKAQLKNGVACKKKSVIQAVLSTSYVRIPIATEGEFPSVKSEIM